MSFTLLSLISGGLCLAAGTIVYAMVRGVGHGVRGEGYGMWGEG